MAIVRIGQLTAEPRVTTDFAWIQSITSISSVQAKTGTYSYHHGLNEGPMGLGVPALSEYRVGWWWYMADTDIDGFSVLWMAANGLSTSMSNSQIRFQIPSESGNVTLTRPVDGSNTEILDTFVLPPEYGNTGTWFHVGITHKIDDVDGFITMWINGNEYFTYEGDTRPTRWTGSAVEYGTIANYVMASGGPSGSGTNGFQNAHMDDFYVDSMVGEDNNPVPSRRFLMVIPTGAGADDEWTPSPVVANYLNVDDNPHDGDSSLNKALSTGLRDTFAMGDVTIPVDHRIVAVLPSPFVKRLDSEIDSKISVHAWDGIQYLDSADLDLSMSYNIPVFARFTVQPDGSLWNEADFNAMQFGYRSRGTF